MIHVGPMHARELVDRLESEIVHPDSAMAPPVDVRPEDTDVTAGVPGSPEPPD